jgi:hypothetical protein
MAGQLKGLVLLLETTKASTSYYTDNTCSRSSLLFDDRITR